MTYRISKAQLRAARERLEQAGGGLSLEQKNRLLTAATALGLAEHAAAIEWIQEPPPRTVLEFTESGVMLVFDREATISLKAHLSEQEQQAAQEILKPYPELKESLQCLGLRSLEGDIQWQSAPPFDEAGVKATP
ncbi:MAG: hypothetical protein ACRD1R_11740 [Acidobacteriota bacterium]